MKLHLLTTTALSSLAQAAFLSAFNTTITTTITTITTNTSTTPTTTITTTTTTTPTPIPTGYAMQCGGSMGDLCGDVCFCGSGQMNCHADPSARCYQMCKCVAEMPPSESPEPSFGVGEGGWGVV